MRRKRLPLIVVSAISPKSGRASTPSPTTSVPTGSTNPPALNTYQSDMIFSQTDNALHDKRRKQGAPGVSHPFPFLQPLSNLSTNITFPFSLTRSSFPTLSSHPSHGPVPTICVVSLQAYFSPSGVCSVSPLTSPQPASFTIFWIFFPMLTNFCYFSTNKNADLSLLKDRNECPSTRLALDPSWRLARRIEKRTIYHRDQGLGKSMRSCSSSTAMIHCVRR